MDPIIIIMVAYDRETGEIEVMPNRLGPDKDITIKDILVPLNVALGQYIWQLQVSRSSEEGPPAVEEKQDDAAND